MKYRYRAVERFWTSFYRLNPVQKESARKAWEIFKENPFDSRLRTHKIQRLPERLKLNMNWKEAIKKSLQKNRPMMGWPKR